MVWACLDVSAEFCYFVIFEILGFWGVSICMFGGFWDVLLLECCF